MSEDSPLQISQRQAQVLIWLVGILVTILLALVGFSIWAAATGRSVSHVQMDMELREIHADVSYLACVLELPPDNRTEDNLSACATILGDPATGLPPSP